MTKAESERGDPMLFLADNPGLIVSGLYASNGCSKSFR